MMRDAGHKSRRSFFALALFALLLALVGWFFRPSPPLYTVADFGTMPGESFSAAAAINSRGDVVGNSQNTLPSSHPLSAFVYRGDAVIRLSRSSRQETSASAVSDSGLATGFATTSNSNNQAVVFSGGRLHLLGTLPGYAGSFGTGINTRGQVVGAMYVSLARSADAPRHAFLYSGGRMTALCLLPGWPESQANGINASGKVAGDCTRGFNASQAFLYDSTTGKTSALPTPAGMNSRARAINPAGDVAGGVEKPYADGYAAVWQNGRVKNLGTLPGTETSMGTALNDRGQAVGTSFAFNGTAARLPRFLSYFQRFMPTPQQRSPQSAWVYRDGRMSDLNALIPRRSGWTLETATGINDRGQIVGSGQHDGQKRAFLLTPR